MVEKLEVQILGEGDLPEELNKSTKALDGFGKGLTNTEKAIAKTRTTILDLDKDVNAFGRNIGSTADFMSGLGVSIPTTPMNLFGQVLGFVADQTVKSVVETSALNNEITRLSLALGITTEETSRLIETGDDLRVSQEAMTTSLQFLSKAGMQPTIENAAKLSDKLLSITDVEERNKLATQLLGRSWFEAANFWLAGGDKIRKGTAAIADNMVVTEKASKESSEYAKNLDNVKDSAEGVKRAFANHLLPAVNDVLTSGEATQKAYDLLAKGFASNQVEAMKMARAFMEADNNIEDMTNDLATLADGHDLVSDAVISSTSNLDKYITKTKLGITANDALSFSLSEAEKVMGKLAFTMGGPLETENKQFLETQEDLRAKADELKAKIDELRGKRWLGKEGQEQLEEYKGKLAEVKGQIEENANAHDEATKRIMFDLLQQRLAVDGLTLAESNQLVEVGNAWGLIDDVAVKMWDANNNLTTLLENKKITVDQWAQAMSIAAQNGWDWAKALQQLGINIKNIPDEKTIKINFRYQKFGEEPGPGVPLIGEPEEEKVIKRRKAGGGSVMAGEPYWVGEFGPEWFIPPVSGQIIPNNQITNNFNLSVSTVQSAGRVTDDFALMRALAG